VFVCAGVCACWPSRRTACAGTWASPCRGATRTGYQAAAPGGRAGRAGVCEIRASTRGFVQVGSREHVPASRRAVEPGGRARVASLGSCFGRGAVLVLVGWITVTEPAHPSVESRAVSNRRVKSLLGSQSGRDAGDPVDAAPSLGELPQWTVSCAVSQPSSRGPVLQGLVSARAGRPHPLAPWPRPRHQRGTTRKRAWRLPRAFRRPPGGRRAVLGCEGAAGRRPELGSKPS
jgi:hypothetical protein